jgi:hypothetical protein
MLAREVGIFVVQKLLKDCRVNSKRRSFRTEVPMRQLWLCIVLTVLATALISCGNSSNKLESISISPATAAAKNYANGEVQFTASGMYSNGQEVKPLAVLWSNGPPWLMQPWAIQIDRNGVASCVSAPAGTYEVWAGAPINPDIPLSGMNQSTPQVNSTAALTCP